MEITLHASADEIPESDWAGLKHGDDPFASRAFLGTAERVGASGTAMAGRRSTLHCVTVAVLLGLLPLYLRSHSFGDFSRDWNWPGAWRQAGLAYFPKLVSGIPYTPSPGPRLLVRQDADRNAIAPALIEARALVSESGASSWQCLFVEEEDRALLAAAGLLMRRGVQFHWFNRGFADFDDFLAGFTSDKRKKLKRERRAVAESGLRLEVRHGDDIDDALWLAIHRQYRNTFIRYGNHPAFPAEFFSQVARAGPTGGGFPRVRRRYPDGIGDLLSRRRNPLRPPLGYGNRNPWAALRTLLLPGHRVLHPARLAALRARRPGRAQARARLRAGTYLVGVLDCRPANATRGSRFHRPRRHRDAGLRSGNRQPATLSSGRPAR
jgi:hypothetical protein